MENIEEVRKCVVCLYTPVSVKSKYKECAVCFHKTSPSKQCGFCRKTKAINGWFACEECDNKIRMKYPNTQPCTLKWV